MNQKEKVDLIANVLMVCDHDDYTYEETAEELIKHFDLKLQGETMEKVGKKKNKRRKKTLDEAIDDLDAMDVSRCGIHWLC